MKNPWPLLCHLRQGDIEETAIVDARGEVLARVKAPGVYEGDLGTAVKRAAFTAQLVHAATAAPVLFRVLADLYAALPDHEGGELGRVAMRARATLNECIARAAAE